MQYKSNTKILIDKRKLQTLLRLGCPKEIITDLIFEGKLFLTGDKLIDDNLEALIEEKEFKNWGGNRNPKGNNQYSLGQVDHNLDHGQVIGQEVGQLADKDTDKDKDLLYFTKQSIVKLNSNTDTLIEKEKENKKEKESFNEWRGEYANVHLTAIQYAKFVQTVGKKEVADELINDLSENIASKRDKSPPFDEAFPDMHLAILNKYWKNRRLGVFKSQTLQDKNNDFKATIEALTQKYRIEEERELRSG